MLIEHVILALLLILVLSLIAQPVSQWLRLPFASILVVLGFITSEIVVFAGIDTGIRASNFQSIIFYIFLPVLIFESAYNIDKQQLKSNLVVILFLAIIVMLLTCVITAVLLFYGIGHEAGFPWLAALLTAAILAATDPVAVVSKLREMNAPKRIAILLEGESLLNDAAAIVIFSLFLSMALAAATPDEVLLSSFDVFIEFIFIFFGGALIGLLIGLFLGYIQKKLKKSLLTGVMSLVVAYGSYMLAEHFMVSGVMSTLLAGLSFSIMSQEKEKAVDTRIEYLWNVFSHIASVSVFLIMGAVITLGMFEERWLAMLIAVFSLLLARMLSIYGVLSLFMFFKNMKVPLSSQGVMVWGGLRGAVTLALALSLPTELDYWWTIQSIAFGVVIFSLFVQAPTMQLFVEKFIIKEK